MSPNTCYPCVRSIHAAHPGRSQRHRENARSKAVVWLPGALTRATHPERFRPDEECPSPSGRGVGERVRRSPWTPPCETPSSSRLARRHGRIAQSVRVRRVATHWLRRTLIRRCAPPRIEYGAGSSPGGRRAQASARCVPVTHSAPQTHRAPRAWRRTTPRRPAPAAPRRFAPGSERRRRRCRWRRRCCRRR
jgi:hypothetical protein